MQTTKLIVEYIVAGIVVVLALGFLAFAIFPSEIEPLINGLRKSSSTDIVGAAIIALLLTSVVYGVGVISEHLGMLSFEWLLQQIKVKRIRKYFQENREWLKSSPILAQYIWVLDTDKGWEEAAQCYGEMRFDVMMKSPSLYAEIESQINRFRLIRVLFISETLILIALIVIAFRELSAILISAIILDVSLMILNYSAIRYRFDSYTRAVERSHKIIVINSLVKAQDTNAATEAIS